MKYTCITDDLHIIRASDYAVLAIRDREAEDERRVFCPLDEQQIEKLIKELRR